MAEWFEPLFMSMSHLVEAAVPGAKDRPEAALTFFTGRAKKLFGEGAGLGNYRTMPAAEPESGMPAFQSGLAILAAASVHLNWMPSEDEWAADAEAVREAMEARREAPRFGLALELAPQSKVYLDAARAWLVKAGLLRPGDGAVEFDGSDARRSSLLLALAQLRRFVLAHAYESGESMNEEGDLGWLRVVVARG